jgi:hypothetical protein
MFQVRVQEYQRKVDKRMTQTTHVRRYQWQSHFWRSRVGHKRVLTRVRVLRLG